ncbi:MAG: M64 family metallopeptidase [Nanoarchaeota archaeon]|nr:M64 family metallopeptidase [Nanoarchaeota archaeon]MBU1445465.1 M64 family metallopeptidase [Nanoarchaeota archaeon]MBU2420661.1 M64 family metallopeptidase [Nanoarchaeota archaeon]MBU2475398.1 M64 family metallopeptidase [Nanoarchaeota archaeon]MBU3940348.1 M64 family metallopeptidase [Nanoarchaeota archaeon]
MGIKVNSSWLPFVFLIVAVIIIFVGFVLYGGAETIQLSQNVECNAFQEGNGDVNIVFLADNYETEERFLEDVETFKDGLLNVVPFNEYLNNFNFYYVLGEFDLGCEHDEAILCDPRKVKRVSLNCPNDYTVVLTDYNGVKNLFRYLRSSAWQGIACLNTADDILVFAHEFGHLFADFADEYEFDGSITWDAPNCVAPDCTPFNVISNPGCYLGCTNGDYYREERVGIMRDYWHGKTYGGFNEWIIREILDGNRITGGAVSNLGKESLYVIDGTFTKDGVEVNDVATVTGYAPGIYDDKGWSLEVGNDEYYFGLPFAFVDVSVEGEMEGGTKEMVGSKFSVVIPVDGNEDQEVIVKDPNGNEQERFNLPASVQIGRLHELSKISFSPEIN